MWVLAHPRFPGPTTGDRRDTLGIYDERIGDFSVEGGAHREAGRAAFDVSVYAEAAAKVPEDGAVKGAGAAFVPAETFNGVG